MEPRDRPISADESRVLFSIARDALWAWLERQQTLDVEAYPLTDALREPRGAFVTLHNGEELRGCIGHILNREPLALSVRDNAINAATRDHRFPPVCLEELPEISIEISVLGRGDDPASPFRLVHGLDEIEIGRDGLYIERAGMRGGLLLPQVAVEQRWNLAMFLSAVCRKAGYCDRAWEQPDVRLYRFTAQVLSGADRDAERGLRRRRGS